jgi:hypothetical protein
MPENSQYFIGKSYPGGLGTCQIGDTVTVNPHEEKHSAPYEATVIEHKGNICLDVVGGTFKAPLTQKLFNRLHKKV